MDNIKNPESPVMETRNFLAVAMLVVSYSVLAANVSTVFTPSDGINATVEIMGSDLIWRASTQNRTEEGGVRLDTRKIPHIAVDSYDFSGRLGFSVWYMDDGMGVSTISRVFTFAPHTNRFVERFPSCGDEFYNLRVDKKRRHLVSTYYDKNSPKLCATRLSMASGNGMAGPCRISASPAGEGRD